MRNLTMMTDLYQITMMNGYFKRNVHKDRVVFDMFFRKNPCDGGYTIVCGIEQLVEYIEGLKFEEDDLEYLKSLGMFGDDFLDLLRNFEFTGDIYAVEEGSVMFPNEPLIRVSAPLFEAQLIETALLNIINFQSLIATKASRVCYAANGDSVLEFGLRRAQGPDAGTYGARAAVIGGCTGTANVMAGKMFDIPIVGTHAHSWIQKFDSELEAFRAYANTYPDKALLLVDTYNTLESGVPNAIKVFKELQEKGYTPLGIRIDSGDLEYISRKAREMFEAEGFKDITIVASNDLDEYRIQELKNAGAEINSWGVGTRLITSKGCPALGGVYKLAASVENEVLTPKIKVSENPEKINNPGLKRVVRIYNRFNKAEADLILLEDEIIDESKELTIFHPVHNWKRKTFTDYTIKELLKPLYLGGKCVHEKRSVSEIKEFTKSELDTLWPQYKRLKNPQVYKVDLSRKLFDLKRSMINELRPLVKKENGK